MRWIRGLAWILGSVVFLVAGLLLLARLAVSAMCGTNERHRTRSPDNKFDAVEFTFDCGATTGFQSNLSIVPLGQTIRGESGNVYVEDDDKGIPLPVQWLDNNTLKINASRPTTGATDHIDVPIALLQSRRITIIYSGK